VATPIGNFGDITLRALSTLASVDLIACEDTRNSGILLHAFGIKKPTLSYHDHNEDQRGLEILQRIEAGQRVALISDAGMPGLADPGFKLVRACRDKGIPVTILPGANAALSALVASGLPTDAFSFYGFLPSKSMARRKEITALKGSDATLVFYESPQRLAATLADMCLILGPQRRIVVARELTKFYEEIKEGSTSDLAAFYESQPIKGEIVLLVGKSLEAPEESSADIDALLTSSLKKKSVRDAVAEVVEMTGLPRKDIYQRALALRSSLSHKKS
jgi:16S rRNA (cytidine1402-2'-O)-methyltransferase